MSDPAGAHTFLFADLAGFTALTEAHGDAEGADVATEFCDTVRGLLPATAEVVKTIGDAVMVRCPSAAAGASVALSIVEVFGARHGFATVRVGMHHGPAVERDGDWFGSTVNIAARVAGIAAGAQILATAAAVAAAGDVEGVAFRSLGPRELRNVAQPVELYEVMGPGGPRPAAVLDPVCRMVVDPARAAATLELSGEAFHFCSAACARAFLDERLASA